MIKEDRSITGVVSDQALNKEDIHMNTIAFEKFETVDANSLMAVEGGWFWDNWKGGEWALVGAWALGPGTGIIATGFYNGYNSHG